MYKSNHIRCYSPDLLDSMYASWSTIAEREHTVYKVFCAAPHGDEIMFHGRSNNLWKDGKKTTFTWAARMHFERLSDGKVLIDEYTIIVVCTSFNVCNCAMIG